MFDFQQPTINNIRVQGKFTKIYKKGNDLDPCKPCLKRFLIGFAASNFESMMGYTTKKLRKCDRLLRRE